MNVSAARCFAALVLGLSALAWNPIVRRPDGPLRWNVVSPIVWNPDSGPLGQYANAVMTAEVQTAFDTWEAVDTATITYARGGPIVDAAGTPTDVTAANFDSIVNLGNGQNPIVFDDNGEIFTLLGLGPNVLGVAVVSPQQQGAIINKSSVVLNGDWWDGDPDNFEADLNDLRGVILHELGHFSGLGHSDVNNGLVYDGLPGCPVPGGDQIETMSPFIFVGANEQSVLELDDRIGLSVLYPTPEFAATNATVRGHVIARDGAGGHDGGNVVLRPFGADCDARYELAQSGQPGANPAEDGGAGSYAFHGLTPGSAYTVQVTGIPWGGFPLPLALDGPAEFYNGPQEAATNPPDDPGQATPVVAGAAGTILSGIDILLNDAAHPGTLPVQGSGALRVTKTAWLAPTRLTLDDGGPGSFVSLPGSPPLAWVNRFTPAPATLPLRIEVIEVQYSDPSVHAGRPVRLLVYVDPDGSGVPARATLIYTLDTAVFAPDPNGATHYHLTLPGLPPPPTIAQGDFYVGVFDLASPSPVPALPTYDASTASGRSYVAFGSTSPAAFRPISQVLPNPGTGTWIVRASVASAAPVGTVELQWGDPCYGFPYPQMDFAVYEGSLDSLRSTPDHAPIACGTAGSHSRLVLGGPPDRYWLISALLDASEGPLSPSAAQTCAALDPAPCP